jgi:hypothetical protein
MTANAKKMRRMIVSFQVAPRMGLCFVDCEWNAFALTTEQGPCQVDGPGRKQLWAGALRLKTYLALEEVHPFRRQMDYSPRPI